GEPSSTRACKTTYWHRPVSPNREWFRPASTTRRRVRTTPCCHKRRHVSNRVEADAQDAPVAQPKLSSARPMPIESFAGEGTPASRARVRVCAFGRIGTRHGCCRKTRGEQVSRGRERPRLRSL